MILKNINLFTEEKKFVPGTILIKNNRIDKVLWKEDSAFYEKEKQHEILDGEGCYAIPGMIDLHFHGCNGYDFCDGTREALEEITKYEASIGVTSVCPATMTLPVSKLQEILSCAAAYRADQIAGKTEKGANLIGINMEGPFISKVKKGAQDEQYIIPCNVSIFQNFQLAAKGLVKFIGIAPEEGDASSFIREVKDSVTVSLAHTNADYKTAKAALQSGAKHVVHLYNAMSDFHHRDPGVVGAVFDSEKSMAELICDGIHVHPAAVRTAFRILKEDRIVLISDSMRATGLPDGTYTLGGLEVLVKGKYATLKSNGALAGSVTSLFDCVKTCVKEMQIPLETAVACATMNPAKSLGIYTERGSLTEGKIADIVLLDQELNLRTVILNGEML